MRFKSTLTAGLLCLLVCNSCVKKEIIFQALDASKDCELLYQQEKKISKITATSGGKTKTVELGYEHNVVKHLTVTENESGGGYSIYYASGICQASGYNYQGNNGNGNTFDLNGAFTIDGDKIVKSIINPNFNSQTTSNITQSDYFTYDPRGRVVQDLPGIPNTPLQDVQLNMTYAGDNNINEIEMRGAHKDKITDIEYDKHPSPFQQQHHLLYYLKLLPFISLNSSPASPFHFLSLTTNNPTRFVYNDQDILETIYEYSFVYQYAADGYPTQIKVYRADYLHDSGMFGTGVLQEEVTIQYQ